MVPNCLTLSHPDCIPRVFFQEKVDFEKHRQMTKIVKILPASKEQISKVNTMFVANCSIIYVLNMTNV